MQTITNEGLINSLVGILSKKGILAKDFAGKVHVTKSALSNWKANKAIPDQAKKMVADALKDPEFKAQAANNMFGIPTTNQDTDVRHDTLAQTVHLVHEEHKKDGLIVQLEEVLAHETQTYDSREIAVQFTQQLSREVGNEMQLLTMLQNEFDIKDKELSASERSKK